MPESSIFVLFFECELVLINSQLYYPRVVFEGSDLWQRGHQNGRGRKKTFTSNYKRKAENPIWIEFTKQKAHALLSFLVGLSCSHKKDWKLTLEVFHLRLPLIAFNTLDPLPLENAILLTSEFDKKQLTVKENSAPIKKANKARTEQQKRGMEKRFLMALSLHFQLSNPKKFFQSTYYKTGGWNLLQRVRSNGNLFPTD